MPSTVVHLALAGLVGAALLGEEFDVRALAAVLAVTVVPDLDTFVGLFVPGTHRAALHTLLVPLSGVVLLGWERRYLRALGDRARHVAWVGVAVYALAGIGPDLFFNGVNLLYPLHDQFYALSGKVVVSNQRGLVQTVYQPAKSAVGTTANTHYYTGVDVARGPDPADAERVFPLARGGLQLLLVLTAAVVVPARLWLARKS